MADIHRQSSSQDLPPFSLWRQRGVCVTGTVMGTLWVHQGVVRLVLLLLLCLLPVKTEETQENERGLFGLFGSRTTTPIPPIKRCSCSCGLSNEESRIVGGQTTQMNEYPWMARLSYFNRFYCGGMLINDRYVLTAAHCVKGFMWFMIKVSFGEHDRCNSTLKPESRFVIRAFAGEFSFTNFDNDIAVLRLNDRVPVAENIRPICLPKNTKDYYKGLKAVAAGWGTLQEDGKPSCLLQDVEVPVLSNEECRNSSRYLPSMISDNMLCAGFLTGKKDSCQGDSGGPLFVQRTDKKYELIGVVSWGNGCARVGYPGIYTRVTRYLDWIIEHSRDGCFCDDD